MPAKSSKPLPSLETLSSILEYNPETGDITRDGSIAGSTRADGYKRLSIGPRGSNREYLQHRLAWLMHYGEDPGENSIDHIDRNPSNNRIDNLRLSTPAEQQKNQPLYKSNKTGIKGVRFRGRKWSVSLGDNGIKANKLGQFSTLLDAAAARISASNRAGYAHG